MQRALCRVLRSCSKLRENEKSPILATEEIHQKSKNKENYKPPPGGYTFGDALGWTTSLLVTYEFVHRRRKKFSQNKDFGTDTCSFSSHNTSLWTSYLNYCPFGIGRWAINQPIVGAVSTAKNIQSFSNERSSSTTSSPSPSPLSKSIDKTPFLKENESLFFPITFRSLTPTLIGPSSSVTDDEDDDGGIHFDASITKFDEAKSRRPSNTSVVYFAEKLIGDIYSALGAFKFLVQIEQPNENGLRHPMKSISKESGILVNPIELLEKGAALGSGRALYNIGVAYERMNDVSLAREYYQKAADVGHPLASYNIAVFLFKEGKIYEGLRFLRYAAENGVSEANETLNLVN